MASDVACGASGTFALGLSVRSASPCAWRTCCAHSGLIHLIKSPSLLLNGVTKLVHPCQTESCIECFVLRYSKEHVRILKNHMKSGRQKKTKLKIIQMCVASVSTAHRILVVLIVVL